MEFPLIAALVVALGLSLLQLALFLHVRNGLTDIAVQSAYHGALLGNDPSDGLARASELASARFQQLGDVDVEAREHAGVIE
ncbi:MAG: pilus assembly protein, partial [Dermabacter sp.]|nr:pilus assembly protein [Dermabacter sp.]